MGQLKEGNERPIHITLSYDDVALLKATVLYQASWEGTDYGKLTRVYMAIDAAVAAAGYYADAQPQVYVDGIETRLWRTEKRLERLRGELSRVGGEQ